MKYDFAHCLCLYLVDLDRSPLSDFMLVIRSAADTLCVRDERVGEQGEQASLGLWRNAMGWLGGVTWGLKFVAAFRLGTNALHAAVLSFVA
jgi:hypothetical protein